MKKSPYSYSLNPMKDPVQVKEMEDEYMFKTNMISKDIPKIKLHTPSMSTMFSKNAPPQTARQASRQSLREEELKIMRRDYLIRNKGVLLRSQIRSIGSLS